MSTRKYLVLLRNEAAGAKSQQSGAAAAPSPEQLQQMFASYNTWKEKLK